MEAAPAIELDGQYRLLREEAGLVDRSQRGMLEVRGDEAADFLQGQLTNDVEALEPPTAAAPGSGCYAALLDRKGHMRADMRVLRLAGDRFWIDTEPEAVEAVRRHLDMYKVGREIEVDDVGPQRAILSIIGPDAGERAASGLGLAASVVPSSPEHAHSEFGVDGVGFRVIATADGLDVVVCREDSDAIVGRLEAEGVAAASEEAAEILRVEAGRPRFGHEMTAETMPEEAGINDRAVSFTKGCYIGQETVARLHYKGKPNRHLRGLRVDGAAASGDIVTLDGRELGRIGTAVLSPAEGPIALAILRREAEPGARVRLGEQGGTAAVVELPFR